MGKYEPLNSYLAAGKLSEVAMTFTEIEKLIGRPLPPVARKHRAWWSNNGSNNVMTKAWLDAGYRSERVDMAAERLVFARHDEQAPVQKSDSEVSLRALGLLDRIRLTLGGTVTIPEGVDITKPASDGWGAH